MVKFPSVLSKLCGPKFHHFDILQVLFPSHPRIVRSCTRMKDTCSTAQLAYLRTVKTQSLLYRCTYYSSWNYLHFTWYQPLKLGWTYNQKTEKKLVLIHWKSVHCTQQEPFFNAFIEQSNQCCAVEAEQKCQENYPKLRLSSWVSFSSGRR